MSALADVPLEIWGGSGRGMCQWSTFPTSSPGAFLTSVEVIVALVTLGSDAHGPFRA